MRMIDYAFSGTWIAFAAGHGFIGMPSTHGRFQASSVWSFSGSVAAWAGLMIWLGVVANMLTDIRILLHIAAAAGLLAFSMRTLVVG